METSKLKKFAQYARRLLLEQVGAKLALVLDASSAARRENPQAVSQLEKQIAASGREQLIDKVAYTWFNRICALRFMDVNGYTRIHVVSPADEGQFQPEILAEAKAGHIDEDRVPEKARQQIQALLSGTAPSHDPQQEAYRLLVVAECNSYHDAMPYLFERIADFTELLMPDDLLSGNSILAYTREAMTPDACEDVEVIGWLYQFYISEKKDQVFEGLKTNQKIGPENIPAATQLFTPHWIVRYLVENSLGRLWMLNYPDSPLARQMEYYIKPEQPETDFLKIEKPEDIKVCDPACGSGHMLTYAFDLLYAIYEEVGTDPSEIPEKILIHNLYGIELDERAGELAAFALTMKARDKQRRFFNKGVKPNICVLEKVEFTSDELDEYMAEVGRDLFTVDLRETLHQFAEADNFGSLIRPKLASVQDVLSLLEAKDQAGNLFLKDTHDKVLKVLHQADYLSQKYHVVVANPPYMGAGGMNVRLTAWAKGKYPGSKSDLYTMFIERSLKLSKQSGMMAFVTIQNWMFLTSFEKFRRSFLSKVSVRNLIQIGYNSFPELNSKIVQAAAFVAQNGSENKKAEYINLNDAPQSANKKTVFLGKKFANSIFRVDQGAFEKIEGSPLAYWLSDTFMHLFSLPKLAEVAYAKMGMRTGNNERFLRQWFEVSNCKSGFGYVSAQDAKNSGRKWFPYQKGGENRKWYGVQDLVVNWEGNGKEIKDLTREKYPELGDNLGWKITNEEFYFRPGGGWTALTSGKFSVRYYPAGFIIDTKGQCLYKKSKNDVEILIGTMNCVVAEKLLSVTCPTLDFNSGPVGNTPFLELSPDLSFRAENNSKDLIQFHRSDWDAYETSWGFTTLPLLAPEYLAETLAETYSRLRAHWRSMTEEVQRLEEESNRIFIEAYGLQDELSSEVPLGEITLACNPAYRYGGKATEAELDERLRADTIAELLHYAVGCMFGRYSLDKPGVVLSNQGDTLAEYLRQVPEPRFMPDVDNVIPLLDGEWFADDVTERFRSFLRVTFGEEHYEENLAFIEQSLGKDVRKYFIKDFYADHVKRYKKRPIYWLFASPKGTFSALIYLHRYRPDTVSVVLQYLRDFRKKLAARLDYLQQVGISTSASQGEKTRALKEIETLKKQLMELDDYERDTLYPLATEQVLLDLDNGVKVNYLKLGPALKKIVGLDAKGED